MVAEALRDWLPAVLQAVEPWMSAEDIDKGARWSSDIGKQLEQARIGIICLTRDNQHEPWIQFEAGALSKTLDTSFVIPYLLNLKPADVKGPLVQFQAAMADETDTLKLIRTVNKALGEQALSDASLEKYFGKWWPELSSTLAKIPAAEAKPRSSRTDRDILEELLVLMRGMTREQAEHSVGRDPLPYVERRLATGSRAADRRVLVGREILSESPESILERLTYQEPDGSLVFRRVRRPRKERVAPETSTTTDDKLGAESPNVPSDANRGSQRGGGESNN